jgi:hypothetical protein
VNGLKPGVDADQIAQAVVSAIAPSAAKPEWETELVSTLKKLDFRLKGVGASSGAGTVNDILDRANRQLGVATVAALTDGTQTSKLTNGANTAGVEPFSALTVNTGYQTLFYESWSTSPIDTTDKWTVTGAAPTIANGNMQMPATVSTYNAIRTKDNIRPNNGFTHVRNGIQIEAATANGAGRFWGLGTPATVPSATSLVQDGIGFEIDQTTGALLAVSYVAGVRTTVATLNAPTDGAFHPYALTFRVTRAYWFIDDLQNPVASMSFPNVQVVELPALIVRQNAASFTGTPVFSNIAHLTADTSKQGTLISDPLIGTRMARVSTDGALSVRQSTAGTFGYAAGTSGTVALSGGKKVGTITVHCTTAGSLTINGGASIAVPANSQFSASYPDGKLTDPTIVCTGSDSYYIDYLS